MLSNNHLRQSSYASSSRGQPAQPIQSSHYYSTVHTANNENQFTGQQSLLP